MTERPWWVVVGFQLVVIVVLVSAVMVAGVTLIGIDVTKSVMDQCPINCE